MPSSRGAFLKEQQQFHATDAAETMPGGDETLSTHVKGNVVPISEILANGLGADGVVHRKVLKGLIG